MVREKVKAGAHWFTCDFQDLIDELGPVQNGLGTQNGIHVKEAVMNGVANGFASNGFTNGFTDGHSEAQTNGTSNGVSNGITNGFSNGSTEQLRSKVKATAYSLPNGVETVV